MSELLNASEYRTSFRRQCLTTVSAIALLAFSHGIGEAADDDGNRPTVWIELGGQLSRLDSSYEPFAPEFPNSPPRPATFSSPVPLEKSPFYSIDETGKISLAPSGTAWSLSASVRYGRSSASRNMRQGTHPGPFVHYGYTGFRLVTYPIASKFADTTVHNDEQHLIVDFQVGKDVGLGLFGRSGGSSTISVGVRFAQFGSKSNVMLKSDPDWHFHFKYLGAITFAQQGFHTNQANLTAERSFHGVGPTLSWDGSSSIAGSSETGELLFDGGVNAAVLFGRQRAAINHSVVGAYGPPHCCPAIIRRNAWNCCCYLSTLTRASRALAYDCRPECRRLCWGNLSY